MARHSIPIAMLCAWILFSMSLATASVRDTEADHMGRYLAGTSEVALWCAKDPHDIVPWKDEGFDRWFDHFFYDHDGDKVDHLLEGEPECAPGDAANALREAQGKERAAHGFGGFAFALTPEQLGGHFQVGLLDDHHSDHGYLEVYGETHDGKRFTAAGCGPQTLFVPLDTERHWHATPETPLHLLWALIPTVSVQPDLKVCLSTEGWIQGRST